MANLTGIEGSRGSDLNNRQKLSLQHASPTLHDRMIWHARNLSVSGVFASHDITIHGTTGCVTVRHASACFDRHRRSLHHEQQPVQIPTLLQEHHTTMAAATVFMANDSPGAGTLARYYASKIGEMREVSR
jgi:hypothetical protein